MAILSRIVLQIGLPVILDSFKNGGGGGGGAIEICFVSQGEKQDAKNCIKNIIPSGSFEFFLIWLTIQLLYVCKLQIAISQNHTS